MLDKIFNYLWIAARCAMIAFLILATTRVYSVAGSDGVGVFAGFIVIAFALGWSFGADSRRKFYENLLEQMKNSK